MKKATIIVPDTARQVRGFSSGTRSEEVPVDVYAVIEALESNHYHDNCYFPKGSVHVVGIEDLDAREGNEAIAMCDKQSSHQVPEETQAILAALSYLGQQYRGRLKLIEGAQLGDQGLYYCTSEKFQNCWTVYVPDPLGRCFTGGMRVICISKKDYGIILDTVVGE